MKHAVLFTALTLSTLIAACDTASPEQCATAFRDGPTETLYLSQYDAEINVFDFAEMVLACPAKPKLAITFTRHPTPSSGLDSQVIGLGFSVSAGNEWAQCYEDMMLALGAHP